MKTYVYALCVALVAPLGLGSCTNTANVGCGVDSDCADPTKPHCDPNSRLCVACNNTGDCPTDSICLGFTCVKGCDPAHGCVTGQCDTSSHTCVGCVDDGGCAQGEQCDKTAHQCVDCIDDRGCSGGQRCDTARHTCVGCLSSTDCPQGQCDPKAMTCVGCVDDKGCPIGQHCDVAAQACHACLDDSHCSSPTPRCRLDNDTCVECIPATDNCGTGLYCANNYTCQQGCKSNADCGGGTCGTDHNCSPCTTDSQCVAGMVCEASKCVAACGPNNACATGSSCCGGHCFNLQNDVNHCGACGIACKAGQGCCGGACKNLNTPTDCGSCGNKCGTDDFCDGSACQTPTYPNFCKNKLVWVIHDGHLKDDTGGDLMASTITTYCPKSVVVKSALQTDATLVDQTTGAPLGGGGVTYVMGGGPAAGAQKVVNWLENVQMPARTKVYFGSNGIDTYLWKKRDGSTAASMLAASCSTSYDQFLVELVTDPVNGTLSLIGYGACASGLGTLASGWFYANRLLPNSASYPNSWYVFEWKDTSADGQPGAGDTFNQLATGM